MEEDALAGMKRVIMYDSLLDAIYLYCEHQKISLASFCNWLLQNTYPNKWVCEDHPETRIIIELLRTIEYICKMKNISIPEYESRIRKRINSRKII